VTEVILIFFADQSWIGELDEFEVQHKPQALLYLFNEGYGLSL